MAQRLEFWVAHMSVFQTLPNLEVNI
nr:unnamed protein product [Callosobruchus analis]